VLLVLHGDLVAEALGVPLSVLEEEDERVRHNGPARRATLDRERASELLPVGAHALDQLDGAA
jgi:hypothetical protein